MFKNYKNIIFFKIFFKICINKWITDDGYDDDGEIEGAGKLPLRTGFVRTTFDDDRFDEFVVGIADVVAPQ